MEPRIQYAKTADGVSIAFCSLGEGAPIIHVPVVPFSHIQLEWQIAGLRNWYERLASNRTLVRYDARGFGLSDRDVTDFSLDAQLLDLEAVADHLQLPRFCLFAAADFGAVAIAYAARRPERVSHLILWCTWARRADVSRTPQTQTLRALLEQDWQIYTETTARVLLGWSAEADARRFARFYRECATPDVLRAAVGAFYAYDVTQLLPLVRCPTLVLHRRQVPTLDVAVVKSLAARIADSQLVLLEGSSPLPFLGDRGSVLGAVRQFLGDEVEAEEPPAVARAAPVTILLTDMESSTSLTQQLGDARAQEVLRVHNAIVRGALKAQGGREIKHTGDGIMASFASASAAVECAVAIQRAVCTHAEDHPGSLLAIRIGLNAGEPIAEEEDLFGTAVQLAARVCGRAAPQQILASDVVRQLVAGKGFLFADQGEVVLRGFEDPVRLYEVRWREATP